MRPSLVKFRGDFVAPPAADTSFREIFGFSASRVSGIVRRAASDLRAAPVSTTG
jgi:hypothetical protein